MEYIHAAMLVWYATKDKSKITKDSILATLKGAGIEGDPAKAEMVAKAIQGVDIEEALKAPFPAVTPVAVATAEAKKEEKKKEEEEKKAEEEVAIGLAGLFE